MELGWWVAGPFIYAAMVVFITVTLYKVIAYSRMPRHLRWDLYPVPHQGAAGSKYQTVDWFHKTPQFSLYHELRAMLEEMLWIKKAFVNNRKLWFGTFPLHIGIYLSGLWLALLVLGAALELNGIMPGGAWALILNAVTQFSGISGMLLGLAGSLILMGLRLRDEGLRSMSDPVTYLNLSLMITLFGSALAAWLSVDGSFALLRRHIVSLLVFRPGADIHPLVALELFFFGIFLCVLPFSRMMHYAAKYFFYHNILWDDEPVKTGSQLEKNIAGYLSWRVTWSAAHLCSGKSWIEQVKCRQEEGEKK